MKEKNKILISIIVIILSITLIVIFLAPLHKEIIPTRFVAGENMGFDLGPGNINFGKIIPGKGTTRKMNITNNYNKPTITKIKSSGEISKYMIASDNNFILQPNKSKEIIFSVQLPKGLEYGEYPGKIIIVTYKA